MTRVATHLSGDDWIVTEDGRETRVAVAPGGDAAAALALYAEAVDGPSAERLAQIAQADAVVRAEAACRAHIYATLSETAQKTLMAARHRMTTEEAALHDAGLDWIADCRDAFRAFAAGEADDYIFPDPPAGLVEFGRRTRFGA